MNRLIAIENIWYCQKYTTSSHITLDEKNFLILKKMINIREIDESLTVRCVTFNLLFIKETIIVSTTNFSYAVFALV